MAQNAYSPMQHGGVSNGQPGQQCQGHYAPQQGLGVPHPQGPYPLNQQLTDDRQYLSQFSQQGYSEPQNPQIQLPGIQASNYGAPQHDCASSPYPAQQQYLPVGENASYYGTVPTHDQYGNAVGPGGPQDEKGLGSTVAGGAAGGYAGHKLGGGFLGSVAGAVLGAIGMNAATHQVKDRKKKDKSSRRHKKRHGCHSRRRRASSSASSSSN